MGASQMKGKKHESSLQYHPVPGMLGQSIVTAHQVKAGVDWHMVPNQGGRHRQRSPVPCRALLGPTVSGMLVHI